MSNLSERCMRILNLLLQENGYTSLQKLADKTGVSRRSIYYDICSLNEWLDLHYLQDLEVVRGKGILIPGEDKEKILAALEEKEQGDYYVFLPSERVDVIICYLIHSRQPVYIEQLTELLQVSRNTIFGDIKVAVQKLREYELDLEYRPRTGYEVTGDPVRARALFFLYYSSLRPLIDSGALQLENQEEIQEYYERLEKIRESLHVDYVEGVLSALAALLPLMHHPKGESSLSFPGLRREEICASQEYRLAGEYFPELAEDEVIYLTLHLLGSRLTITTEEIFEEKSDKSVFGITKALVTEFEKIACVTFEDRETLERALFIHIKASLYRYQYGIQIGNPMSDDVVREYPNLFEITKNVSKYLEQMIGLPIPDSEVAYLALHFGAFLKTSSSGGRRLRILIVCVNGVSTGNMLRREVAKLLPEADIIGVVPAINAVHVQDTCDLVISTVRVQSIIPVIVVNPILTDDDRSYILHHRLIASSHNRQILESLFSVMKKYTDESRYKELRQDLLNCLSGAGHTAADLPLFGEKPGLAQILRPSLITFCETTPAWIDAVYLAGGPLVDSGCISGKYLDTIVSQTTYYGAYMFITNEIMLAHAKPENGANYLGLSLGIFRNPIPFTGGRKARLIFVLAAEDNERHFRILNQLLTIAQSETLLSGIIDAPDAVAVIDLLRGIEE